MSPPPPSPKTRPRLLPLGDQALVVTFGEGVDAGVNRLACAFADRLRALAWPFVSDVVPAFASVGIHYIADAVPPVPGLASPARRIEQRVQALLDDASNEGVSAADPARPLIEIPVCYGGEHGPDLDELARRSGLHAKELIARHTGITAQVFMLGFAPGLPYIGLWDEEAFDIPRRETPRTRVPAGSVAIANRQCVIYPFDLPGGWHLIGRTPLALFDASERQQPALLAPGDRVRFQAITAREFEKMNKGAGAWAASRF